MAGRSWSGEFTKLKCFASCGHGNENTKKKKKNDVNFGNDFGKCQICKFIQHITIQMYFTQNGQQENIYTLCTTARKKTSSINKVYI